MMRNRNKGVPSKELHMPTKESMQVGNDVEKKSPTNKRKRYKRTSSRRSFAVNTNNRFDILHSATNDTDNPFKALGFATAKEKNYSHQQDTSGISTDYPYFLLTPESPMRWKWDIVMSLTLILSVFLHLFKSHISRSS